MKEKRISQYFLIMTVMWCLMHFNEAGRWSENTTNGFWLTDHSRSSPLPGCVSEVCTSPPLPPPPRCLYSLCPVGGGRQCVECGRDGATPPSWCPPALPCRSGPRTLRRRVPEDRFCPPRCSERELFGSSSSECLLLPRPLRPGRRQRKWC